MLVKDIKQKLYNTEFGHCTDAIISFVLNRPRVDISPTDFITANDAELCEKIANDWRNSFPIAYQRNKMFFMDIPLIITKDVFPPVIATEPFVNGIIEQFGDKQDILEIGTGSGAMAIVIAKKTTAKITATDICPNALEIAKKNAELNGVSIQFIKSDLYENIEGKYDLIFSNPPQQTTSFLDKSEKAGTLITPRIASDGGEDGFSLYNAIIKDAKKYLKEDGILALHLDGTINIYKANEL